MIEGRSIFLRQVESTDLEFLKLLANDPRISAAVVGWDFPVSSDDQTRWYQGMSAKKNTFRLTVVDMETNEPIGLTGLWDIDWHNQSALTATKLHPDKVNKGQGTDAILATMAWSFYQVGLRRLHGAFLDFNSASMGAYIRKCGWKLEGCEAESIFRKGQWHDLYTAAALRRDFDALDISKEYIDRICPVDVDSRSSIDPSWWRNTPEIKLSK